MRFRRFVAASVIAGVASGAAAAPFDPDRVSADATWVLHIDFDALAGTRASDLVLGNIENHERLRAPVAWMQEMTGLALPGDLHDVLLFGNEFTGETMTAVVSTRVKSDVIRLSFAKRPEFTLSEPEVGPTIYEWKEGPRTLSACFVGEGRFVISATRASTLKAADRAAGRIGAPPADSMIARGAREAGAEVIVYAACESVPAMLRSGKVHAAVLDPLAGGWGRLSQAHGELVLHAELRADRWWTASALKFALGNAASLIGIVAPTQRDNPEIQLANRLLATLSAESRDEYVVLHWPVALWTIEAEMRQRGLAVPAPR